MAERVTLEFLSKQMDRLLVELQQTHEGIGEIREIMRRCITKARDVQELLDELSSLMSSYATD